MSTLSLKKRSVSYRDMLEADDDASSVPPQQAVALLDRSSAVEIYGFVAWIGSFLGGGEHAAGPRAANWRLGAHC